MTIRTQWLCSELSFKLHPTKKPKESSCRIGFSLDSQRVLQALPTQNSGHKIKLAKSTKSMFCPVHRFLVAQYSRTVQVRKEDTATGFSWEAVQSHRVENTGPEKKKETCFFFQTQVSLRPGAIQDFISMYTWCLCLYAWLYSRLPE